MNQSAGPASVVAPDAARTHSGRTPPARRRFLITTGILIAVCSAVYANAIRNPFHFDDISIILSDPRVQGFQTDELLTGNYWYVGNSDKLYRPLTLLSYAVNWAACPEAWAFRLPNLVLHVGTCVLLSSLVLRVFGSYAAALGAAVAMAIHPLGTEPLNTIVGRADLLVSCLVLGAAVLYWDDQAPGAKTRLSRPMFGGLCLAAGLLCKENAMTLVGVVGALDAYRLARGAVADRKAFLIRRLIRCYVPMLLIIGAYLGLRVAMLGQLASGSDIVDYFENPIAHPEHGLNPGAGESAWLARWATPLATLARALRLTVVPTALCFDYSYAAFETVRRISDVRLWSGLAVVIMAAIAFGVSIGRQKRVALAIALSAVTYSIVSNVIIVIGTVFGERLLYLPLIGYCMLIGLAAGYAFGPARPSMLPKIAAVGLAVLGLFYAYLTVQRNRDWRSENALYASAYQVNPKSCKVLAGMAAKALDEGDLRQALQYCDEVINEEKGVAPEYWPSWRTAGVIVRKMAATRPSPDQQRAFKEQALGLFIKALRHGAAGDPDAIMGAAELYVELRGDYVQAIRITEQFIGYRPDQARAFDALARWLLEAEPPTIRDAEKALGYAESAQRLAPGIANYAATLADALANLGRTQEAIDVIYKALASLPADSPGVAHFEQRLEELTAKSQPATIAPTSPTDVSEPRP